MIPEILSAFDAPHAYLAAGWILISFTLAALAVHLFWMRFLRPVVGRLNPTVAEALLPSLRRVAVAGIVLMGLAQTFAALPAIKSARAFERNFDTFLTVVWIAILFWQAIVAVNRSFALYLERRWQKGEDISDLSGRLVVARKLLNFALASVGLLFILRTLELDITPLLAGGALGGLVVGLALQGTLSDIFAGFDLAVDRPVRVGDFVKLENGEEGHVEEIGWRKTRIRLLSNNVVIVPNSRLSTSIVTNYYLPEQETSVYVQCGVAYGTDLDHAEAVAVGAARQAQDRVDGQPSEWEPLVRWKEFGSSSITFTTILRTRHHDRKWLLQSEFIKELHRRFRQEGIEIPFPIQTTVLKGDPSEPDGLRVSVHSISPSRNEEA
ncbi:MAG: mechanosensitive ion channel family protein [Armatimonadota bacterium]